MKLRAGHKGRVETATFIGTKRNKGNTVPEVKVRVMTDAAPRPRKNGQKKAPKKKRARGGRRGMDPYAAMVSDPCMATQKPGLYGSTQGMIARFHQPYDMSANATWGTNDFGYAVWFPSYHAPGGANGKMATNFFYWTSPNATTQPVLVGYGALPLADTTTAKGFIDPAYNFVAGDVCQDARTLSACMKLSYAGSTSQAQGFVYPITNLSISTLLYGGTFDNPPTVQQMLAICTTNKRADGIAEVVWRPSPEAFNFRNEVDGVASCNATNSPSVSSFVTGYPPMGIGFVFYGVNNVSNFIIDCYKNVEWRSEPISGMTQVIPRGIDEPSILKQATNYLDRYAPGWQTTAKESMGNLLTQAFSQIALGGAGMSSGMGIPRIVN